MAKELKNLRSIIESCYDANYNICDKIVLIDEETTRGFETKDNIILTYKRAAKDGMVDCIEVIDKNSKDEDPIKKHSEGKMIDTYSKVVTECLKYDIDIAKYLKDVDRGSVRGFESKSYIVITYKVIDDEKNLDYISFLKKFSETGEISEGKRINSSKGMVEKCFEFGVNITEGRLFLEEYSSRGIDFGDYIILRYREVTKDDYINSAAIGLIDKKEQRVYSLRESALMLDDKMSGLWKAFGRLKKLEGWEAEVLKGYKDVVVEKDRVIIEGDGTFIIKI